ncbi:unnamed protein product, partial [marine sediment metagenome]
DPAALADAIASLWDRPDFAATLAANGRQEVERNYNATHNAASLSNIFLA